jgi:hypothetical protein
MRRPWRALGYDGQRYGTHEHRFDCDDGLMASYGRRVSYTHFHSHGENTHYHDVGEILDALCEVTKMVTPPEVAD